MRANRPTAGNRRRSALLIVPTLILASCAANQQADTSITSTVSTTSTTSTTSTSDDPTASPTASPASTSPDIATTAAPPSTSLADPCEALIEASTTVEAAGGERSFDLVLPADMSADDPAPLLILLHGYQGQATTIASRTNLLTLAPEAGVALAVPQGVGEPTTWHYDANNDLGDAAFLDSMLRTLTASPCIDTDNVWLSGFSAGSGYTAVFGCPRADRFAGLLMVSGLAPPICPEQSGLDLLIFHGIEDPIVAFDGGDQPVGEGTVKLASIPESAAGWAERAGCDPTPASSSFGDADRSIATTWSTCALESTVRLVAIESLGHTWPTKNPAQRVVDASCAVLLTMTDPAADPVESCFG